MMAEVNDLIQRRVKQVVLAIAARLAHRELSSIFHPAMGKVLG
jgi:hypothetical protein